MTARPAHLRAVDVVRVTTVAGVIAVHAVSANANPASPVVGAIEDVLHVNREVFLLLSAFVLTYAYGRKRLAVVPFWRRRSVFVVVPYVLWSAVYCTDSGLYHSVGSWLGRFAYDLATGAAWYHLYFLLLTLQLYAVFPVLVALARRVHHRVLLAVSLVIEIGLLALFHYHPPSSGLLGAWSRHPETLLVSYQFSVVAGTVAALHLEDLTTWLARHRRTVLCALGAALGAAVASYAIDLSLRRLPPTAAAAVFQPATALDAVAVAAGLLALGGWLEDRRATRMLGAAHAGADLSFGVYLVHPLLLQALLAVASTTGTASALARAGTPAVLGTDLFIVTPLLYAASAGVIHLARRTPLSLPLTGRAAIVSGARLGSVLSRRTPHVPRRTQTAPAPAASGVTT